MAVVTMDVSNGDDVHRHNGVPIINETSLTSSKAADATDIQTPQPSANNYVLTVVLRVLLHLALAVVLLVVLHYIAMTFQQEQVRSQVIVTSYLLSDRGLSGGYWWDFGTLLGLVRESDVIWTEVDADISLTRETRDAVWNEWSASAVPEPGNAREMWQTLGFVELEERDEYKLRFYGSWGWYLDMDVWELQAPNKSMTGQAMPPTAAELSSGNITRIQMITGRQKPATYNLPREWIVPVRQDKTIPPSFYWTARRELRHFADHYHRQPTTERQVLVAEPYLNADVIPSAITYSIPAEAEKVLAHWYGPTWRIPRKFDKGIDQSGGTFEHFMYANFVTVYELFWTGRVIVRCAYYGWFYHSELIAWYGLILTVSAVVMTRLLTKILYRRQQLISNKFFRDRLDQHDLDSATAPSCHSNANSDQTQLDEALISPPPEAPSTITIICGYIVCIPSTVFWLLDNVSPALVIVTYLAALCALGFTLDSYRYQIELGFGMWQLLTVGIGLPLLLLRFIKRRFRRRKHDPISDAFPNDIPKQEERHLLIDQLQTDTQ